MSELIKYLLLLCILTLSNSTYAAAVCVSKKTTVARASGSSKAKEVGEYRKFTPLKWSGKKEGPWIEVSDYSGQTSWIRRKDVSFNTTCVVVRVGKSRLRTGPGKDFPAAQLSEKGWAFKDLGGEDGWTQVESEDGTKAWVNLDHTWKPSNRTMRLSFEKDP